MGYDFSGIITNSTDEEIVRQASVKWSFVKIKKIDSPFSGLAIINYVTESYPKTRNEYEEDFAKRENQAQQLEAELKDFSIAFPVSIFCFIVVECFGGTCVYSGYCCRNGEIISSTSAESLDSSRQHENLQKLLNAFNIKLNEVGYFEPFTRGYFEK